MPTMKTQFLISFVSIILAACQSQPQHLLDTQPVYHSKIVDRSDDLYIKKSADKYSESYLQKIMHDEQQEQKKNEKEWKKTTQKRPRTCGEAERKKSGADMIHPHYDPKNGRKVFDF